jgi:hypothetical protein
MPRTGLLGSRSHVVDCRGFGVNINRSNYDFANIEFGLVVDFRAKTY